MLAFGGIAGAQDKTLYWQRYDVDLDVQKNGDLQVEETQELVFTDGTFRYGQREIPINRLSDITNVTVRELNGPVYRQPSTDEPYTYRVFRDGNNINIRYNFPPSSDMRRTIVIDYTVTDALRYYPEKGVDQLFWKAIPAGNPFPTQSSTITLHVPEPATFTNYGVYGADADGELPAGPARRDDRRSRDRSEPGRRWRSVAEWQHGIVAGQPQPWQRAARSAGRAAGGARRIPSSQWGPVLDLSFLALAGLLVIGGPVLLYLWWYRKGRDAPSV